MKYKAGHKVLIKPFEKFLQTIHRNHDGLMDKYAGTVMTISYVHNNYYEMVEDNQRWHWFEDMIDRLNIAPSKQSTKLLLKLLMKG